MDRTEARGRVALVMGATGGIGEAIVRELAIRGYSLAVHYATNQTKASALVNEVHHGGTEAIAVSGDVADVAAMSAVFDTVERELGGVDVVVNTSGIMLLSTIQTLDLDDLDRMYRTNIRGTFAVAQQASSRLRPGGALINFSTTVTRTAFPSYGGYAATKAAVEAMTLILARELRGKDITVNTVAPGPTATPLFLEGKDEQAIANLAHATPMERIGTPDDIAQSVAFLAGPARWINGQVIFTNGGLA